jgi:hypothetical protein
MTNPILEQVLAQAQMLSLLDKVRLVKQLLVSLEHDMETTHIREWQATIERTAGALANDPIERPDQGEYENRDQILWTEEEIRELMKPNPRPGKEIAAMLEQMDPIELVDPEITDPVE